MAEIKNPFQVALITTTKFRDTYANELEKFLEQHLIWMCQHLHICTTGNTFQVISKFAAKLRDENKITKDVYELVMSKITPLPPGSIGIVAVSHHLIEGRVLCVIHLSHYKDINTTFASSVLKRQSRVHNVLYTDSITGGSGFIEAWKSKQLPIPSGFRKTTSPIIDVDAIAKKNSGKNNIAMIAHNEKKLELCVLGVTYLDVILSFDHILCTGTTGSWLKKFIKAAVAHNPKFEGKITDKEIDEKFVLCETGPKGGDVQIAHVALQGYCSRVVFLIDPMEAHPHEPDIRFFEQAIESSSDHPVQVATNSESAQLLLSQAKK